MSTLNLTSQPIQRGQETPGPVTPAGSGDVSAVQSDVDAIDTRVTDIEGWFAGLGDYADDAAAAAGGVAVGSFYRNGSALMQRQT